ncbi:S24 family peptidase [Bacteroides cellulosilyticus]|jgi:SOS-response transcriptional repressor LexA|uniref:S24 family peptidase n=1 Tax=Bacteroides cellulosilyticus TaxID=246787 RepID=UPI00041A94FC|nr:S24 family peptidase [Bacteroides cellulosilyticus]DAH41265.1 MAG TPA: Repressor protein CI [Caudoviricetes sp.]
MNQTINERIKQICDYYFAGNVSEMARAVNIKQSTIRDIVGTKQSKPSFETLKAIVDCPTIKVNTKWLLVGAGNVFDEDKGYFYFEFNENKEPVKVEHFEKPLKKATSILQTRPRIPYTAAAGSLTSAVEGITADQCEQIPRINIFPEYDFTIIIKGDSMEPKYEGGDEVACKRIDSTSFIQWGKVHVLDTAQGILIKRTYEDGDKIRCVSYNPEYPDFSIDKSEIYSMSLVVGLIRL